MHEGQFVGTPNSAISPNEGLTQVREHSLTTVTFAVGADAGTQLGVSTPTPPSSCSMM